MPKRARKQLRKQTQKSNLPLLVLAGLAGALIITLVLVLTNQQSANSVIEITPVMRNVPITGTSLGDPNAPVRVDVWADFQCPGCRSYSEQAEPQIVATYVATGQVYYTFHFFPFIDGGAGESHQAANAALCAAAQNRFWDYHDLLFANWQGENAGSFSDKRLVEMARALKLEMTEFNQCFQANAHAAQIEADQKRGQELGVPPTPGIFVNEQLVVSGAGPNYVASFDDVAKMIAAALNGK